MDAGLKRPMPALLTVAQDEADIRLDRWVRRHFPGLPQSAIQKLCRTGQVRVDGHRTDAATRLGAGQLVRVPPLAASPQVEKTSLTALDPVLVREAQHLVIYRDDHVIVVNKPPGLAVQGGPGITRHLDGMLDALRFDAPDRPRLVHRLDRDTSGLLILARTPGTAAKLAASFRGRDVEKTYWAVVARRPVPPEGKIDIPLKRVSGARGERTEIAGHGDDNAARATTAFRTLDHAGKLAWLELRPLTGRTHQLRVHCVAIGAPILGDVKYAQPDQNGAFGATVAGLSNALHLHARRLRLPHPAGGFLEIEADLPRHFRETFRTLGFAAPAAHHSRRT